MLILLYKQNQKELQNYKDYKKHITTRDNGKVQSHEQEQSKVNSTININSSAHTLTHYQIIKKSSFNKNNIATIKTNKILTKIFLLNPVEKVQWCQCNVPIQRCFISHY